VTLIHCLKFILFDLMMQEIEQGEPAKHPVALCDITFPAETMLQRQTYHLQDSHSSLSRALSKPIFLGHDRETRRSFMGNRRAPAVLEQNTQKQQFILIVEDDPGIGFLLLTALQQETAYDALLVEDGESALHLIATHKPHLVIVDYQLPGMNGLDLVDRIRTMNGLGQVPVLIISANLPQTELAHRHLSGLSKPFEIETLFMVVERLLSAQAVMRC
jgi:CheY-like chemotaxis protein